MHHLLDDDLEAAVLHDRDQVVSELLIAVVAD